MPDAEIVFHVKIPALEEFLCNHKQLPVTFPGRPQDAAQMFHGVSGDSHLPSFLGQRRRKAILEKKGNSFPLFRNQAKVSLDPRSLPHPVGARF